MWPRGTSVASVNTPGHGWLILSHLGTTDVLINRRGRFSLKFALPTQRVSLLVKERKSQQWNLDGTKVGVTILVYLSLILVSVGLLLFRPTLLQSVIINYFLSINVSIICIILILLSLLLLFYCHWAISIGTKNLKHEHESFICIHSLRAFMYRL